MGNLTPTCIIYTMYTWEKHRERTLQPGHPTQPTTAQVPLPGSHSLKHSIGGAGSLDNVTKPWCVRRNCHDTSGMTRRDLSLGSVINYHDTTLSLSPLLGLSFHFRYLEGGCSSSHCPWGRCGGLLCAKPVLVRESSK